MAQFKRIFHQDLTKRRIIHHCEDVVFTGDNLSDKIGVYLYDNGEPYAGGGTVSGTVINSRGQTVPITTGEISGNLITVTLEEAALAVPGIIGVYVKLTSGQQIATVLCAMFTAMPTETNQAIDPGTIIPSVTQLITDIQTAVDSIPPEYTELLAAVAPTFSASTAYTSGAYVWQGGNLYRFTADHPAGTWTGTDAVRVSLADDLGRQVSDLRSAVSNLDDIVLGQPNYTIGYYVDKTGELVSDDGYCATPFIPLTNGTARFYYGTYSNKIFFVCYDSSKVMIQKAWWGGSSGGEYRDISSLDANVAYVRFGFTKDYAAKLMRGNTVKWEAAYTGGIEDEFADVDEQMNTLAETVLNVRNDMDSIADDKTVSETIIPTISSVTFGYVGTNGTVVPDPSTNMYYCNKIPVNTGDVLTRTSGGSFRFVTAYDGETAVSASGATNTTSYTVPDGIDVVIISIGGAGSQSIADSQFAEIRITRAVTQYAIKTDDTLTSPFLPADARATGNRIATLENNVGAKKQCYEWRGSLAANATKDTEIGFAPKIGFSCGLYGELAGTFSGLTLQFDAYSPNQIIIAYDPTEETDKVSVTFKSRFIGDTTRRINMDISDTFSIMVYADNPNKAKVTIYSNGVKNTVEADFSITAYETFKIINGNNDLSNIVFTMGCGTINHPVWLFGDSYFGMRQAEGQSMGDKNRWPYYACENGYVKNAMFCGSTGSGHAEFNLWYDSLIELGNPNTIICCMGMNYPSDTSTEAAGTWKEDIEKLIADSQSKGYELILATIPSVPTKSHEQKNAFVRSSGYRYIDFAKAVGAQQDGEWTVGMLSTDKIHPTVTGAIALYSMAISSVPELTYDYK